ncbi:MAG: hypothetical protein R2698_04750 [Microthrixaceae bacterium]
MRTKRRTRLFVAALAAVFAVAFVAPTAASAQTGNESARHHHHHDHGNDNGSCRRYIPRFVAISRPRVAAGQSVTLAGVAYPGDTVTVQIGAPGGPVTLGTATANVFGIFALSITIPASLPNGTYQIFVISPNCPTPATVSIRVGHPAGFCWGFATRRAERGDTVNWRLLGRLRGSGHLTVDLVPLSGGPAVTVFSGSYPHSNRVSFQVPNTLSNGRYAIAETSRNWFGVTVTSTCGRLVVRGSGGPTSTTTTPTTVAPSTSAPTTVAPSTSAPTTVAPSTSTPSGQICPVPSATFDGTKLIKFDGYNPEVAYSNTVAVNIPAGTYQVTATAAESYPSRIWATQTSEIFELQFLDASGNVIATSDPTHDLQDGVASATWSGSVGTVTLASTATGVRAHHRPDLIPGPPEGIANSVVPIGFTVCGNASVGSSSVAPSTAAPTTTPLVESVDTGNTGNTAQPVVMYTPPTSSATPTGVLGADVERGVSSVGSTGTSGTSSTGSRVLGTTVSSGSSLATTGSSVRPLIILGIALLAGGALMVQSGQHHRRRTARR